MTICPSRDDRIGLSHGLVSITSQFLAMASASGMFEAFAMSLAASPIRVRSAISLARISSAPCPRLNRLYWPRSGVTQRIFLIWQALAVLTPNKDRVVSFGQDQQV